VDEDLVLRLRDVEDGFTERKTESASPFDFRRTLVAFANSVPVDKTAILFIGVSDDGTAVGVTNPDSLQRKIRELAEKDCYPPISHQVRVFEREGKSIVAVLVNASSERPHFSGPAFVRVGSESVAASPQVYEELVASRNSKAGQILRNKENLITLKQILIDRWGRHVPKWTIECRVERCDANVVHLYDIGSGRHFSEPLEKIRINFDDSNRRMMLEIVGE
jgi:hypothetical protein